MKIGLTLFALIPVLALLASPQPSKNTSMDAFWDRFKAAVTQGDKEAVFAMSQLPIGMSYGESRIRTKTQFMKRYRYIFADQVNAVNCFKTAKPEVDKARPKEFIVGCPFAKDSGGGEPFVYTFKFTSTGWRFVSFENINE